MFKIYDLRLVVICNSLKFESLYFAFKKFEIRISKLETISNDKNSKSKTSWLLPNFFKKLFFLFLF